MVHVVIFSFGFVRLGCIFHSKHNFVYVREAQQTKTKRILDRKKSVFVITRSTLNNLNDASNIRSKYSIDNIQVIFIHKVNVSVISSTFYSNLFFSFYFCPFCSIVRSFTFFFLLVIILSMLLSEAVAKLKQYSWLHS